MDMAEIFDSHAHYDSEAFDEDRAQVLAELKEQGVCAVINCGSDLKTSRESIQLAKQFAFIRAAVGIHPHEAAEVTEETYRTLIELLQSPLVVAVGEIGLDYHYDFCSKGKQIEVLRRQLAIAKQLDFPVIIHDREAHGDMYPILREFHPKGVIHCFSGSVELAREAINNGMYIGLGGAVTFKNARVPAEVAEFVPDDRLLIETDAPYMTPVPFRGKRCTSAHIAYTAQRLAEIRGTTKEEILMLTRRNANKLFGLNY